MTNELIVSLIVAAVTGGVSSALTLAGMRVRLQYMEKNLDREGRAIVRAHERLDAVVSRLDRIESGCGIVEATKVQRP